MTLILLPNLLSESREWRRFLPDIVKTHVESLNGLIAESESGARRFLSLFDRQKLLVAVYNKKTADDHLDFLLEPLRKGETWGLISDAGLPCIADPGYKLVHRAREMGFRVEAVSGPSSLFLALMLSGLPAQNFHFHGYLEHSDEKTLKTLAKGITHLFIEAPHRSSEMLQTLLAVLPETASLSISWDLYSPTQNTLTKKIGQWRKFPLPNLTKKPAIFVITNRN